MNDTITIPRTIVEQLAHSIERLVAKVEPNDREAREARTVAVALIQRVSRMSDRADDEALQVAREATQAARAEHTGAQVLLAIARKAEQERWAGPSDLAENHDKYIAEVAEAELQRIHDYSH